MYTFFFYINNPNINIRRRPTKTVLKINKQQNLKICEKI